MSKNKKTILVNGALGKMGEAIVSLCKNSKDIQVKYAIDSPKHKLIGESLYSDKDRKRFKLENVKVTKIPLKFSADLIIDFSTPNSALSLARKAGEFKIPFVTGTTGFTSKQIVELRKISNKTPILQSYNMSLGINLLRKIINDNINYFANTDLEVTETHHKDKVDSPSGTALLLADSISKSLGRKSGALINFRGKSSSIKRKKGEIGMSVIRGGDIVGEHKVSSFGYKENIYLTHQALDREVFASGSINLGLKLMKKKKGFFSVQDLI
ncbi:4-hydroxy-tetrahydrodipicolinate reductase [bacterium]|jgi:4-hydroxy-tetrahydrodipicolinate reductase|nr:4-hydroxy-tetrahydrodipicolinate reductase [bacterium]MBT4634275.1 4-hydroxy-tetrahydrodipicolinate reductase [bacterium]